MQYRYNFLNISAGARTCCPSNTQLGFYCSKSSLIIPYKLGALLGSLIDRFSVAFSYTFKKKKKNKTNNLQRHTS